MRLTEGVKSTCIVILSAVYEAVSVHVDHDHALPKKIVKSVAKTINNDNSHEPSPAPNAIWKFLFRLQNEACLSGLLEDRLAY